MGVAPGSGSGQDQQNDENKMKIHFFRSRKEIQRRKEEKPNEVTHVPKNGTRFIVLGLEIFDSSPHVQEDNHAHKNMHEVKGGQQPVIGEKGIKAEGVAMLDFLMVFHPFQNDEKKAAQHREIEKATGSRTISFLKIIQAKCNQVTTAQEDHGVGEANSGFE